MGNITGIGGKIFRDTWHAMTGLHCRFGEMTFCLELQPGILKIPGPGPGTPLGKIPGPGIPGPKPEYPEYPDQSKMTFIYY